VADERRRRWWMREGNKRGKRWPARRLRGYDDFGGGREVRRGQEATVAADEKRDLVAAAGRQVTQCNGGVALMAVDEGTMAADERGATAADGKNKRCLGGGSAWDAVDFFKKM